MKYICLGYIEPGKFENMSESERNTVLDECFSYNDELRKNGKVAVTDGPYPETKEQLGGIQVLEARDLNHAIQLISPMPGSEVEVWNNRDTSSGGYQRNDERERAATAKGHLAMRAATRERMFSITARGWPGGNPVNPVGRHVQQKIVNRVGVRIWTLAAENDHAL